MDVENKTVSEKKQDFMRYQSEFNGIDNFANKGMSDAINALRDIASVLAEYWKQRKESSGFIQILSI